MTPLAITLAITAAVMAYLALALLVARFLAVGADAEGRRHPRDDALDRSAGVGGVGVLHAERNHTAETQDHG